MGIHRPTMEIFDERISLFKAIKKSRTTGMRHVDMLKHVFLYQQNAGKFSRHLHFSYYFDRNLINVHMPYLKRDGVVKCQDGRWRCLGYIPKGMKF